METFFWHLATPKFNCNTLFNNNPSFQSFHSFQNEQRLRPTFSILRHNYHFILQFFLPDYEMFFNIICCFRIEKNLSAQASFMVTFYFTKDVLEKGCIEQDEQLSSKKTHHIIFKTTSQAAPMQNDLILPVRRWENILKETKILHSTATMFY